MTTTRSDVILIRILIKEYSCCVRLRNFVALGLLIMALAAFARQSLYRASNLKEMPVARFHINRNLFHTTSFVRFSNQEIEHHLRDSVNNRASEAIPGTHAGEADPRVASEYPPIDSYGMIGNMRTAALINLNGSVDWYCTPDFDSPSVFGRLLDARAGGYFQIAAACPQAHHKQRYWPDTNVLITRFLQDGGIAELEDFMPLPAVVTLSVPSTPGGSAGPVAFPSSAPTLPVHALHATSDASASSSSKVLASSATTEPHRYRRLVRRMRCVRGEVRLRVHCEPAFNYGRDVHSVRIDPGGGATFTTPTLQCALRTRVPLTLVPGSKGAVAAEFTLREGNTEVFVFEDCEEPDSATPSSPELAEAMLLQTTACWQHWVSQCTYRGRWREQVHRSALALKLLTYEPTGAMVAAVTTSLPEVIGGQRNWDYRYCWLRDTAFAIDAFLSVGFKREAAGFVKFITSQAAAPAHSAHLRAPVTTATAQELLSPMQVQGNTTLQAGAALPLGLRAAAISAKAVAATQLLPASCSKGRVGGAPTDMQLPEAAAGSASIEDAELQPLYTIHGARAVPPEQVLGHWEGYCRSSPVRVGNAACRQVQRDIFGELMYTLLRYDENVEGLSHGMWTALRRRCDWLTVHWREPDDGLWEMRGRRRHYTFSKVMCWVALDRAVRLADQRSLPGNRVMWATARDAIYDEVMARGWSEARQAFVQSYGSEALDASLLTLPLVGFIAPTDPRVLATIDAILRSPAEGGLSVDGLLYRYPPRHQQQQAPGKYPGAFSDGMAGAEGTFTLCSCWLVEALAGAGATMPGRLAQAHVIFERVLGFASPTGLFSEQTGATGLALGNCPQAFTHSGLVSAACALDRALG